jgi:WD40 repeat protein
MGDAPDLGLLTSFARDIPALQGAHFCNFPQERTFFDDDADESPDPVDMTPPFGAPPQPLNLGGGAATALFSRPLVSSMPSSSGVSSIIIAIKPQQPGAVVRSFPPTPPISGGPPALPTSTTVNSGAGGQRRSIPFVGFAGTQGHSSSSNTATTIPTKQQVESISSPSSQPQRATVVAVAQPKASPAATVNGGGVDDAFVFGDFGAFQDSRSGGGAYQRRLSRAGGPTTGVSAPPGASEGDMSTFGDFSYFIPKASEPTSASKLEQSFNRSMIRRTSVVHHKVLDELEDASEDSESEDKADSFSFSDFSLSSDSSFDVSPASKSVATKVSDDAFMFGDFMVEMPEGHRNPPPPPSRPASSASTSSTGTPGPSSRQQSSSAATTTTTSSTSASLFTPKPPPTSRPATSPGVLTAPINSFVSAGRSRIVKRQPILFGGLVRDVTVTPVLGHPERVRGAVFASTSENCVVSSGGDHSAQLRPFQNDGTPLSLYFGHQDMILHVAIAPDLNLVSTCGSDGVLSIFEVATSKRAGDCRHPVPVLCSSFSKNGKYIVSGAQDGVCRLWSSKKKNQSTPMSTYFGHKSLVTCISFQPNGEFVATGSGDTQVHIWSASTGKSNQTFPKLHAHTIMNVQFSQDGARILTCDITKVALSDVQSGALLASLDVTSLGRNVSATAATGKLMFTCVAFAPQAEFPNYFFVATTDKIVALHEFVIKGSVSGTSPSSPRAPVKKGDKPMPPPPPDITVTVSPEVWSWPARHRVAWLSTGPKMSMLVGDLGGNLTAVRLIPRQGDPMPQKTPLKVKLVK